MGWQPAKDLTTTFGAPLMYGKPACYMFRHIPTIVYVGGSTAGRPTGRIFQLRWENNAWQHKDLTFEAAGAPFASFYVRAYVAVGKQHVVYLDQSDESQVQELYADDSNITI